jgi:hypothetical protein
MRVKICARKRTKPSSHSPLLLDLDLHQCKQCGAIYRAKVKPVFHGKDNLWSISVMFVEILDMVLDQLYKTYQTITK